VPPEIRSVVVLFDDDSPERTAAAHEYADRFVERAVCRLVAVRPAECAGEGPGGDPYGLAELLPALDIDAAVLVAPRRRGSRRLVPGPVVAGVPVGIVQADRCDQLPALAGAPDPEAPWIVAAMAKNVFLDPSDDWAARLDAVHPATDLRADRARRTDLLDALANGPSVVLYAGHGSPRGWAGYQALRVEHCAGPLNSSNTDTTAVRSGAPAGLMMAFACKTLARHRGRWPFGSSLVETGSTLAYLAPATTVRTADAERLSEIVVDLLVDLTSRSTSTGIACGTPRVCDLLCSIEQRCRLDAAAGRAWATYRLIGDPLTPLV